MKRPDAVDFLVGAILIFAMIGLAAFFSWVYALIRWLG